MNKHLVLLAWVFMWMLPCVAQDIKDMNFGELRTNCVKEIEEGKYIPLKKIKVTDFKVLAWYRERDDRPVYVDYALCWAEISTKSGTRWVLLQMARNPMLNEHPVDRTWNLAIVLDAPNRWFLYFEKPPKNDDVYGRMSWFRFKAERDWVYYDSKILDENWESAIGEKPTVKFSQ